MQQGLSPEEFKRQSLELAAVAPTQLFGSKTTANTAQVKSQETATLSEVEKRDQAIAQSLRERSQAEAAKKLASGQVHSTPEGAQEGPVKPLSSFLDVEKLRTQDQETITKLWAGYHTIKNKLSAVIPTKKYLEMLVNARKYPQFVLPCRGRCSTKRLTQLEWPRKRSRCSSSNGLCSPTRPAMERHPQRPPSSHRWPSTSSSRTSVSPYSSSPSTRICVRATVWCS